MKKIILLFIFSCYNISVFSQVPSLAEGVKGKKSLHEVSRHIPVKNQTQSPPFFSEDFSAGIPAGWTNVDNSGNGVVWRTTTTGAVNTTSPVDEQLNPVGTSAANGYLILDSDSAGPGITQNSDLISSAINCSGHSIVHLSFNEYFAQYGASTGTVSVSNDNVNWIIVHQAESGLASDSGTANPNSPDIDISAVAANMATVYVRFNYTGSYDYWWFADDFLLYEPSAIDLSAYSILNLNDEYTKIPFLQATELSLSGEIKNAGFGTASGGSALLELVDVGSALTVFSENVALSALSPGSTQTVLPSSSIAPPSAGVFKSRITVVIAGDGNASNNIIESSNQAISDSTYQRDDDVFVGVQGIGFGAGANGMAGQSFVINSETDLTSVTFFLKDTFAFGASGTPLFLTIHPQQNSTIAPDGASVLGITDTLFLFDGMIPAGGAFYTLQLQGGSTHLTPGLYFIAFHEVDGLIPMGYTNNIITGGAVWAYANSIGWFKPEDFGFYLSYMIRANFGLIPDFIEGHSYSSNELQVYPNPSDGKFKIRFSFRGSEITSTIFDLTGRVVDKGIIDNSGEVSFDMSEFHSGIYYLYLKCNESVAVRQICISKQ